MENVEVIKRFLAPIPNGYGSGDGSGDGYGDGSGYGDCSGFGDGDGSGDGTGYGSGYGFGYGYGSGFGYGYGSGFGDGFGSGSGSVSGFGIKSINGQPVWEIDGVQTLIDRVYDNRYALGAIVKGDLSTEICYIARVGNSFAHGETLHDALRDAERKELEDMPLEERIDRFIKAYPDPDKPVPFRELYDWHHTLTGSCTQGRDNFVREHGLDMEASYSVRYFIEITAHTYGGDAIRQLAEAYGIIIR